MTKNPKDAKAKKKSEPTAKTKKNAKKKEVIPPPASTTDSSGDSADDSFTSSASEHTLHSMDALHSGTSSGTSNSDTSSGTSNSDTSSGTSSGTSNDSDPTHPTESDSSDEISEECKPCNKKKSRGGRKKVKPLKPGPTTAASLGSDSFDCLQETPGLFDTPGPQAASTPRTQPRVVAEGTPTAKTTAKATRTPKTTTKAKPCATCGVSKTVVENIWVELPVVRRLDGDLAEIHESVAVIAGLKRAIESYKTSYASKEKLVAVMEQEAKDLRGQVRAYKSKSRSWQRKSARLVSKIKELATRLQNIAKPPPIEQPVTPLPLADCTCVNYTGRGPHKADCARKLSSSQAVCLGTKREREEEPADTIELVMAAVGLLRSSIASKHDKQASLTTVKGKDLTLPAVLRTIEHLGTPGACAEFFGVSRSSVKHILDSAPQSEKKTEVQENAARSALVEFIKIELTDAFNSLTEVSISMLMKRCAVGGYTVSRGTLHRLVRKHFRHARCRPMIGLSEANKAERKRFCIEILRLLDKDATIKDPSKKVGPNILFTDEKIFRTRGGPPSVWVPIDKEVPYVVRHRRASGAMSWIGFSANWTAEFIFVEGNIDSKKYHDMLKGTIGDAEGKFVYFQQDNAPGHVGGDFYERLRNDKKGPTWLRMLGCHVNEAAVKGLDTLGNKLQTPYVSLKELNAGVRERNDKITAEHQKMVAAHNKKHNKKKGVKLPPELRAPKKTEPNEPYIKSNDFDIRWPPNSPDLNPVEHYWAFMQRKQKELPFTGTVEEMKLAVLGIHNTQEAADYRRELALGFRARLEKCVKLDGGQIDLAKEKKGNQGGRKKKRVPRPEVEQE